MEMEESCQLHADVMMGNIPLHRVEWAPRDSQVKLESVDSLALRSVMMSNLHVLDFFVVTVSVSVSFCFSLMLAYFIFLQFCPPVIVI